MVGLILLVDIKIRTFYPNLHHFLKQYNATHTEALFTKAGIPVFVTDKEMRLEPCQLIPKVPQQMSNRAETRIQIFCFLVTLLSNIFLSTNRPPTPSYDYIYVK